LLDFIKLAYPKYDEQLYPGEMDVSSREQLAHLLQVMMDIDDVLSPSATTSLNTLHILHRP
jgi:hypothetical protein